MKLRNSITLAIAAFFLSGAIISWLKPVPPVVASTQALEIAPPQSRITMPPAEDLPPEVRAYLQEEAHRFAETPDGAVAMNLSQRMSLRFAKDTGTAHIEPDGAANWDMRMRFIGSATETLKTDGDTLRVDRGEALEEWFINSPAGVEHGFTATEKTGDVLRLALAVESALVPELIDGNRSARFRDAGGEVQFHYSGLTVFDALGRTLESEMELAAGEAEGTWELALVADVAEAVFPVTVDPLMSTYDAGSLVPVSSGDAEGGENAGISIAMSGHIMAVGIPGTASGGEVMLYKWNPTNERWGQLKRLRPEVEIAGAEFGRGVDIQGKRLVVGAPGISGQERAYVFEADETSLTQWEEVAIIDSEGAAVEAFGQAVAIDGNIVVVGAPRRDINGNANAGGITYYHVFSGSPSSVTLLRDDKAISPSGNGAFGSSLSIDAGRLAVGEPSGRIWAGPATGVITMFRRKYTQEGTIPITVVPLGLEVVYPALSNGERFGTAVSLEGDTLVVGSPQFTLGGANRRGAAYVLRDVGGWDWQPATRLLAPDGEQNDFFGQGVALSGDTVIVGALGQSTPENSDAGAAYVFERSAAFSGGWEFFEKVFPERERSNAGAGTSVAASGDLFALGAPFWDLNAANQDVGQVSVYQRRSTSWRHSEERFSSDDNPSEKGASIALDGNLMAAGTPGGTITNTNGAVRVFRRSALGGKENWAPYGSASPTEAEGQPGQRFGDSIALNDPWLLVGAPGWDAPGGIEDSGRAYLFLRSDEIEWTLVKIFEPAAPAAGKRFGEAVDLDARWALVGAPGSGDATGVAHLYDIYEDGALAWGEKQVFTGSSPGGRFGAAVALDSNWIAIGEPNAPGVVEVNGANVAGEDVGRVSVHKLQKNVGSTIWGLEQTIAYTGLTPDKTGRPGARAGTSVAIESGTVWVGEPGWPGGGRVVRRDEATGGSGNWGVRYFINVPSAEPTSGIGTVLAVSDRFVVTGAPDWSESGSPTGAAFVFDRATQSPSFGEQPVFVQKLLMRQALDGDRAGAAVAVNGNEIAVGVPGARSTETDNSGALAVFTRQWWSWNRSGTITGSVQGGNELGTSIATDGEFLIAGAPFATVSGNVGAGFATLFQRNRAGNGAWGIVRKLIPQTAMVGAQFGTAVDIDGGRVIVGAPNEEGTGAAYIFDESTPGISWSQVARITRPGLLNGSNFGDAVGIDDDLAAVGAPGIRVTPASGPNAGSIFTFGPDHALLGDWGFLAEIRAPLPEAQSFFGRSLDVEGQRVLVGAPLSNWGAPSTGSAHLYARLDKTVFGLVRTFLADDRETGDLFGTSVALEANYALIGTPGDDDITNSSGAAYLFDRTAGDGVGAWDFLHKFIPGPEEDPSNLNNFRFGSAVAVGSRRIVIGAPEADRGARVNVGAVFVYDEESIFPSGWGQVAKLTTSPDQQGAFLGKSVAMRGSMVVAGAPMWDGSPAIADADEGAIFAFFETRDAYIVWATNKFGVLVVALEDEAITWGPGADPDGDGLTNLEEAYYNTNPNQPDAGETAISVSAPSNELVFRWREGKETNGTVGRVTWSTDLHTWNGALEGEFEGPANYIRQATIAEGTHHFIRELRTRPDDDVPALFLRLEIRKQ